MSENEISEEERIKEERFELIKRLARIEMLHKEMKEILHQIDQHERHAQWHENQRRKKLKSFVSRNSEQWPLICKELEQCLKNSTATRGAIIPFAQR